jgi:hypothetical protein
MLVASPRKSLSLNQTVTTTYGGVRFRPRFEPSRKVVVSLYSGLLNRCLLAESLASAAARDRGAPRRGSECWPDSCPTSRTCLESIPPARPHARCRVDPLAGRMRATDDSPICALTVVVFAGAPRMRYSTVDQTAYHCRQRQFTRVSMKPREIASPIRRCVSGSRARSRKRSESRRKSSGRRK